MWLWIWRPRGCIRLRTGSWRSERSRFWTERWQIPFVGLGFAEGVTLADGTALSPAEVEALTPDRLTVKVRLRQGVYHQIKRMFGVYGAGVNALHRDAIGGLALDPALAPGQWRELSAEEVTAITTED